jgi:hypothetical protein
MSRWVIERSVSFRPRDLWGLTPFEVRRFLFHPREAVIDTVTVSLSGRYPKPRTPGAGGWSFDLSLGQLVGGRIERLNLDDKSRTFVRTDAPLLLTTEWFRPVEPELPLFAVFSPGSFALASSVPRDFEVHVTVKLLLDQTL